MFQAPIIDSPELTEVVSTVAFLRGIYLLTVIQGKGPR